MAQAQAATDLPDTVKTELLGLYRQALEQITVAEGWEAKTKEFEVGRERAPELLREVQARLEQATTQPAAPPVPEIPPEETLEQLAQTLADKEAQLRGAQDEARTLEQEAQNRSARRSALPQLIIDANKRLEGITKDLGTASPAGLLPQVAVARRTAFLAKRRAVEQEIRAYEEELRFLEARSAVLAARREEAKLAVSAANTTVAAWQELVSSRRQARIEEQRRQAEERLAQAPPSVRELLEHNAALTDEWAKISGRMGALQERYTTVSRRAEELGREYAGLLQRESEASETIADILGLEMRRKRAEIMALRDYVRDLQAMRKEAGLCARRIYELDQQARELEDLDARIEAELQTALSATPGADGSQLEQQIRELYLSRQKTLAGMQTDYRSYADDLRDVITAESKILSKAEEFLDFIDQNILWLRSTGPLYTVRLPEGWHRGGARWLVIARSLVTDVASRLAWYALAVLAFALLMAGRKRMRASLRDISQRVARPLSDSYRLTLIAFVQTILLSLPGAVLLWFLSWRVGSSVDVNDAETYGLAQAASAGLARGALVLWILAMLWNICRNHGLAEAHFRWNKGGVRRARRSITWLSAIWLPAVVVLWMTEYQAESAWRASVGRVAFIVVVITLSALLRGLLKPTTGVLSSRFRRHPSGWLYTLRHVWYPLAVAIPLALALASAVGYHYSAVRLGVDYGRTIVLVLGLVFLHALLIRWLFVAQRKMAIEQARKARAAAKEEKAAEHHPEGDALEIDEEKLSLVTIGDQTRRLVGTIVALALVIGLWAIWANVLPALSFLNDVELWAHTVTVVETDASPEAESEGGPPAAIQRVKHITLANLLLCLIVAGATIAMARNIPGLLEISILQKLPLDTGGRYAITALARYTIVVVGIIAAFGVIGVGWSKVQWLAAAVTVGLGFGLQEIFANFVSGLMLLFERPIRIGDTVTVGNVNGTVTRIRIRATTITDWDRKELVIPNKEFITGQVINWSLSDSILRATVPVGIAYGSDTDLAEELLYKVAAETENALAEPKPKVLFVGFGDNSLNFELRVFVPHVEYLLSTRHALHKAIDAEFRKAGIEIAFPQRDIHVRSIHQPLAVTGGEGEYAKANVVGKAGGSTAGAEEG
ncbi:MAG: mechanosensitive ion channel [Phycisphaerales bacterium]|nr:MAG: mechanosensitive ion channel [Phycisphaerales bacterium]